MSSGGNDMRWTQRVVPPIWLLLALLTSGVLHHLLPIAQLLEPPATWLGLAPLAVGVVLTSKGFGAFRRAGTPVVPFRRSTALVTWGVYRLTRNPMYLGLTLILAGTVVGYLGELPGSTLYSRLVSLFGGCAIASGGCYELWLCYLGYRHRS